MVWGVSSPLSFTTVTGMFKVSYTRKCAFLSCSRYSTVMCVSPSCVSPSRSALRCAEADFDIQEDRMRRRAPTGKHQLMQILVNFHLLLCQVPELLVEHDEGQCRHRRTLHDSASRVRFRHREEDLHLKGKAPPFVILVIFWEQGPFLDRLGRHLIPPILEAFEQSRLTGTDQAVDGDLQSRLTGTLQSRLTGTLQSRLTDRRRW